MASLIGAVAFFGRHGRWVLPAGLLAGLLLPAAAAPMRAAIPFCIAVLLFIACLRVIPESPHFQRAVQPVKDSWQLLLRILFTQLLLPCLLFYVCLLLGLPVVWCLALTLVAAAPPISGSPNLVLLMGGDARLALQWLIAGTAVLPLTCIPVLYLLSDDASFEALLKPTLVLTALIAVSVGLAYIVRALARQRSVTLPASALDGVSALVLAAMVIGLLSAVHDEGIRVADILVMLGVAIMVNVGLQCLGVMISRALNHSIPRTITNGVVNGNRNIALFLSALPAAQMEPLLLFIACYQVPMYLTPLIGGIVYRRLE